MNSVDLKNPELQEKLRSAQTPEEMLALAKEEGFEITDAALHGVAGGDEWTIPDGRPCSTICPKDR